MQIISPGFEIPDQYFKEGHILEQIEQCGGQMAFIKPCFSQEESTEFGLWKQAMEETERLYLKLLETSSHQAARTVLPNSCKTEIMVHATLEEWQHIFRLRASPAAGPSMREIKLMMLPEFERLFPAIFHPVTEALGLTS